MAITPEEAGRVSKSETKAIEDAEREVDEHLKARYQGTGSIEIISPLDKLTDRCRRDVIARYRRAGWDIRTKTYEADPRDPREVPYDAWIFTAGVRESTPPYSNTGSYLDR